MCSRIMYKRVIFLQLHYNTKLRKHKANAKSMDLVHGTNCSERLSKVNILVRSVSVFTKWVGLVFIISWIFVISRPNKVINGTFVDTSWWLIIKTICLWRQENIPVGCVPPAGGRGVSARESLPGSVCPGGCVRGVSPGGVCWGVGVCLGVSAQGLSTRHPTPCCEQNDWQTGVKTLPNYVADGN